MTSFYLLNKSFAIVVFQQVCHSLGSCIACKSWLWETFNKCWNFTLNLLILSGGVSRFVPYLISWIVTLWLKKKSSLCDLNQGSLFFLSSSMTPALEMPSGTAQSIPWWPMFLMCSPAGLLSAMCGTCHRWSKRFLCVWMFWKCSWNVWKDVCVTAQGVCESLLITSWTKNRKERYSLNFKWAWVYVGCIPCSAQTWDLRLCVVWDCPRNQRASHLVIFGTK